MRIKFMLAGALLPAAAAGVIAYGVAGVGGGFHPARANSQDISGHDAQAAEPSSDRLVLPGVGRDGFFPTVNVSNTSAFQGGAVMVTVSEAQSGTVSILGRNYTLSPDATGSLSGLVGFGTDDPAGSATMAINLVDSIGDVRNYTRSIEIKRTTWTQDSFTIPPAPPPDPNQPPPPPLPNDNLLLPTVYANVSARKWLPHWALPFNEPNLGPCNGGPPANVACVSGYFGEERIINGVKQPGHHLGTDIGAYEGTPVLATNDGTVVMSGLYLVRGNLVAIDHGGGVFSSYGHMSRRAVSVGDTVKQGDVIGYVGSTGLSSGPHLHWEVAVAGVLVDGLRWLDGTQGF